MPILLFLVLVIALLLGPGWWVRRVMHRYRVPDDRYGGTGAEFARHLLDRADLLTVKVEETPQGDHYDPVDKAIRLSPEHFNGRSLSAITIAAHEVGHALQDEQGFAPLRLRTRLVRWSRHAERLGAALALGAPLIGLATRLPAASVLVFLGGLLSLGSAALVHLVTLPTEFDASFGRALPMLQEGDYLYRKDQPHARRLLYAAALTYVSASLASLLNVARWWALLRR